MLLVVKHFYYLCYKYKIQSFKYIRFKQKYLINIVHI